MSSMSWDPVMGKMRMDPDSRGGDFRPAWSDTQARIASGEQLPSQDQWTQQPKSDYIGTGTTQTFTSPNRLPTQLSPSGLPNTPETTSLPAANRMGNRPQTSLIDQGWKGPTGPATMGMEMFYNKDTGEQKQMTSGGWSPPSESWSRTRMPGTPNSLISQQPQVKQGYTPQPNMYNDGFAGTALQPTPPPAYTLQPHVNQAYTGGRDGQAYTGGRDGYAGTALQPNTTPAYTPQPAVTDKGSETTTSTQAPWSAQQPYLDYMFNQAKNIYEGGGPQYYQDSQVSPFAPAQEQAMAGIENRARTGSTINAANNQMMTDTLQGKYLDPATNPYLTDTFNTAAAQTLAPIQSAFSDAGRYGSGINQQVQQRGLNELATNIYGGNYGAERGRQMTAAQIAPQIANQDYYDYDRLMGVGSQVQNQAQNVIADNVQRYNYNQNLPQQNLNAFQNYVGGNQYGSTTTDTKPMYSNSGWENAAGYSGVIKGLLDAFTK